MRRLLPLRLVAVAIAASRAGAQAPAAVALDTVRFAPSLGVDLAAGSRMGIGLYYRDITPGAGATARRGDELTVRFSAWLPDGTPLVSAGDSSSSSFTFRLGSGVVVAGWEDGVAGMQVGGRRQLVFAAARGYGARRVDGVPENSVLVFNVELLSLR